MTKILEMKKVCKSFDDVAALYDINFELSDGEILAILGESGCGKSTMLGTIAGFFGIDSGEIYLYGHKVASQTGFVPPKKRNVGILFQDYALFPHFTVRENILFGISHLPSRERRKRYDEMIETLDLPNLCERYPHELSGGQQQRVALARSLAPRPSLILFDEPFSNLNHALSLRMRRDIKNILKEHHLSAILVTHDRDDAFYLANRIVLMEKGNILDVGTPKILYNHPKNMQSAQFLGNVNLFTDTEINAIKDTRLREWLLSKKGIVRPKELHVVKNDGIDCIQAEVIENTFFGDWYEIIIKFEDLSFSIYQQHPLPLGTVHLHYHT